MSVTFWNRIEPRPRSADIGRALCAEIRDPLWTLTRQWQVGEFQGEDAGSPVWAELKTRSVMVGHWASDVDEASGTYNIKRWPFERVVQAESYDGTDLLQSAALGAYVEAVLRKVATELRVDRVEALVSALRRLFPLQPPAADDPRHLPQDGNAQAFFAVCAGQCLDGHPLMQRVRRWGSNAERVLHEIYPASNEDLRAVLTRTLERLKDDLPELLGPEDPSDSLKPYAWDRETLRYRSELRAADHGVTLHLTFTPDRDGMADWWNFDLPEPTGRLSGGASATRRVHPGHVRFAGMPNARWWDFESATTDFGAVQTDRRDLARMAVMEFMLVQSNDWFMIPFQMHIGTLCQIESLRIHDVFGDFQDIPTAVSTVRDRAGVTHRWAMYATSTGDDVAPFFFLPPSAGATRLDGPVLEEVQFLRDEMANMGWVVEHTVPTQIGDPLEHRNREIPRATPSAGSSTSTLAWTLQSKTPPCWYPLLPVRAEAGSYEIVLRLGREALVLDTDPARIRPVGRILHAEVGGSGAQWREEEIPRDGVRIVRRAVRTRWLDGSTHVWTMRARQAGSGEGSSGLRFDQITFSTPHTNSEASNTTSA